MAEEAIRIANEYVEFMSKLKKIPVEKQVNLMWFMEGLKLGGSKEETKKDDA